MIDKVRLETAANAFFPTCECHARAKDTLITLERCDGQMSPNPIQLSCSMALVRPSCQTHLPEKRGGSGGGKLETSS